jgi:hypothetical protein
MYVKAEMKHKLEKRYKAADYKRQYKQLLSLWFLYVVQNDIAERNYKIQCEVLKLSFHRGKNKQ